MSIKINDKGLKGLSKKIARFPREFKRGYDDLLETTGVDFVQTTKRHASGRPGPNIITGQYVSSFYYYKRGGFVRVTNDSPQTARLEYGFYGEDSLGRNYHQPAFPHMSTAREEVLVRYRDALGKLPATVWRSL